MYNNKAINVNQAPNVQFLTFHNLSDTFAFKKKIMN